MDASGNSLYKVNYFAFGGIVPGSESGAGGDRFKFAGREWDGELGLYYNRARYYDPNTGRFISEDPLGFFAGDPNLYRYCINGPTLYIDPSGNISSLHAGILNPGLADILVETGVIAGGAGLGYGAAKLIPPAANAAEQAINMAVICAAYILSNSAKSQEEYDKHKKNLEEAERQLEDLIRKLDQTKGPKRRKPIEDAIEKLKKAIKGHKKEMDQKWPDGRPGQ